MIANILQAASEIVTGETLLGVTTGDQAEIKAQVEVEKGVERGCLDGGGNARGVRDGVVGGKGREGEVFSACRDCGLGKLKVAVEVLGKVWRFDNKKKPGGGGGG